MYQYCPTCGAPMTFYQQNQSWYCHSCQRYAASYQNQTQAQYFQPQPMSFVQQPSNMPDVGAARSKIYGAIKMRDTTDRIIPTSWAALMLAFQVLVPIITLVVLYFWLVSGTINLSTALGITVALAVFAAAIAMVIFQAVLIYWLVKRRDEHFRRDGLLRQGMIEYLDALSIREQKDINVERWTLNSIHYSVTEVSRGPRIWALLSGLIVLVPIIGIFALIYCLNFLTVDVHNHDKRQRDFNYQFQLGLMKLGRINSISYDWHPLPKRDTGAYVLLTLFTLGFALPYWWYIDIRDMNMHERNQWHFESQLIHMTKEPEVENEVHAQP